MSYKKLTRKIAPRDPVMLIRDPNGIPSPYDERAPGLYPDETALALEDGTEVAVSVERHWLGNGAGIGFHAFARAIEEDGTTKLSPNEKHIEAALTFNCDPLTLAAFGADNIAADLARVVLGEPQKLLRDVETEEGSEKITVPVINLPEEVLLNGSIVAQLEAVRATESTTLKL